MDPFDSNKLNGASRCNAPTLLALTLLTLLIHGYHPYAEDGGIYAASVKLYLNPSLFPHDATFVGVSRSYSLFDWLIATSVHLLHLPLEFVLFGADLLCIYLTLLAAARLAALCFEDRRAPLYAAALTAAAFTLPVAGTALFFMEPYLTARSFSTPCSLLAICCFLKTTKTLHERRSDNRVPRVRIVRPGFRWSADSPYLAGILWLTAAALLHAAMALYTAAFITLLLISRLRDKRTRILTQAALAATILAICTIFQLHAPAESAVAIIAAHTRTYWFLSTWQPYEWLGILCPLVLFALVLRYSRNLLTPDGSSLLRNGLVLGAAGTVFSLLFCRYNQTAFPIARLQPLRVLHNLYDVMLVLLGALSAHWAHKPTARRMAPRVAVAGIACVAAIMFLTQRATFPASVHIEWPTREPRNPCAQAFLWARRNTPRDALFAIDANYVTTTGEDAQIFRAIAERSMLSDYSKDGGTASLRPTLAPAWLTGSIASKGLNHLTSAERYARLKPLGVTWLVLRSEAQTRQPCSYDNGTVKVCPLDTPATI